MSQYYTPWLADVTQWYSVSTKDLSKEIDKRHLTIDPFKV